MTRIPTPAQRRLIESSLTIDIVATKVGTRAVPYLTFRRCLKNGWLAVAHRAGFGPVYRATNAGRAAIAGR